MFLFPAIQVGFFTSDNHENHKNRDATKIETRDTSEEDATKRVAQRHLAGTRGNRSMVFLRQLDDLNLFLKWHALVSTQPESRQCKMTGLNRIYGFRVDGSEALEDITVGCTDNSCRLHRRALRRASVASAMLMTAGALSLRSATTAETPNTAVRIVQRTIIAFATLSYVAGIVCNIHVAFRSGSCWSTMLFATIVSGVVALTGSAGCHGSFSAVHIFVTLC